MVQRFYDCAGCKKLQSFKESVNHKVENSRRPGAQPLCQKHIANLAHGRISQHPFNIVLGKCAEACH